MIWDRGGLSDYRQRLLRRLLALFIIAGMALLASNPAQAAAKRLAFVVGNSDYAEWPLVNPVNDARAISNKLADLGFDVTTALQLQRDDIGYATEQFLAKVSPGDIVVFFFAGHGVQVNGQNYLLATDAKIRGSFDVPRNSIDVDRFLSRLDATRASVKLVFLDACRNNPFEGMFRGGKSRGLARIGAAPFGTLISFATQPGGVAADGEGKNGLYTTQLLQHIDEPGLPVEQMLKRVAVGAHRASGGKQQPWMEGNLYGNFMFREPRPEPKIVAPTPPVTPKAVIKAQPDVEQMAWQFAAQSNSRSGYEAYLREFPDSPYARLARIRLATMPAKVIKAAPATKPKPIEQLAIAPTDRAAPLSIQPTARPVPSAQPAVSRPRPAPVPVVKTPKPAPAPKAVVSPKPRKQTLTVKRTELKANPMLKAAAAPAKKEPVKVARAMASTSDKSKSSPATWDIKALDGKRVVSGKNAPFDVVLRVAGQRLYVEKFVWTRAPYDIVDYSRQSMRCGLFSSYLTVSANGQVSGNCSGGGVSISVGGHIKNLQVNANFLAPGGATSIGNIAVPMQPKS